MMIPFAIMSGHLMMPGQETIEIRIMDLTAEGFTFRLADDRIKRPEGVLLHFWSFRENGRKDLLLQEFTIADSAAEEKNPFYQVYRLQTPSAEYAKMSMELMKEYGTYVRLKQSGEDGRLAKELTGYPAQKEEDYPESFSGQCRQWMKDLHTEESWEKELFRVSFAMTLDHPKLWNDYLSAGKEAFLSGYFAKLGLEDHPLSKRKADYFYIGNSFCDRLFPDTKTLKALILHMKTEQIQPVLVLPPVRERRFDRICKILRETLDDLHGNLHDDSHGNPAQSNNQQHQKRSGMDPLEIVVNDWGMLRELGRWKTSGEYDIRLTLGILMQKMRKDVRLPYKKGYDSLEGKRIFGDHGLNTPFYRDYLEQKAGISRYSFESCERVIQLENMTGKIDLYLPLYQMNTSGQCTLKAAVLLGERGKQMPLAAEETDCSRICGKHCFLYPSFLGMIGKYQTLFGYDRNILQNAENLRDWICQGADRIIWNL